MRFSYWVLISACVFAAATTAMAENIHVKCFDKQTGAPVLEIQSLIDMEIPGSTQGPMNWIYIENGVQRSDLDVTFNPGKDGFDMRISRVEGSLLTFYLDLFAVDKPDARLLNVHNRNGKIETVNCGFIKTASPKTGAEACGNQVLN